MKNKIININISIKSRQLKNKLKMTEYLIKKLNKIAKK
jgi:hypothetical protein